MRIFENIECKAIRVGSELTCISENIKGTLRLNFDLKSHFPKAADFLDVGVDALVEAVSLAEIFLCSHAAYTSSFIL